MKKAMLYGLVICLALVVGLPGAGVAKEWKKVRVATEGAYPPWNATAADGKRHPRTECNTN